MIKKHKQKILFKIILITIFKIILTVHYIMKNMLFENNHNQSKLFYKLDM